MNWKIGIAVLVGIVAIRGVYSLSTSSGKESKPDIGLTGVENVQPVAFRPQGKSTEPSKGVEDKEPLSWIAKITALKTQQFKDGAELRSNFITIMNDLMIDESLPMEERISLRDQLISIESERSKEFPEKELVGFTKTLVNENDPNSGYNLDPQYK